jgi:hypothetical protein
MSALSALDPRSSFVALVFGLGLALAWPGVEVRAQGDLAPPSRELTRLGAAPAPAPSAAGGESCAASDPTRVADEYAAQRAAMEALAAAMQAQEAGDFVVLDGRGNGYFAERNPALELARLQREAQLQARAAAEAGAPQ